MSFLVKDFFDETTSTFTYVVYDPKSKDAVVIDPVWDFDPPSGALTTTSYKKLIQFLNAEQLAPKACFETHVHADHLSASQLLKKDFPALKVMIRDKITVVQETFKKIFNLDKSVKVDGSQFDYLFKDGEVIEVGTLSFKIIATPGHTPACTSILIGDSLFVGDSIFMPDTGTGRCDFPHGSAEDLFDSITKRIYALPESTKIYLGHDYKNGGKRAAQFLTTVGEQKKHNIHVRVETNKEEYVQMRKQRDSGLTPPKLLLPSLQVNMLAGRLPDPENNGVSYLKLPLKS
jgi:glyoxylase-like metal-dependent hydrolase (beta-lactamase superfamily II)